MAEPLDDGDDELIKEFTQTLIGSRFTKDLEIYERFEPKTEGSNPGLESDGHEPGFESDGLESGHESDDKDANQ